MCLNFKLSGIKEMNNVCGLCDQISELRKSHVIPKFVFSWLKNTSVTGNLRFGEKINRRVQDGVTLRWLCADCEVKISKWEKYFSEKIFHPLLNGKDNIPYDENFIKFCVSLSWRVLKYHIEYDSDVTFDSETQAKMNIPLQIWKKFLLGEQENPAECELHAYYLGGEIICASIPTSKNFHRYWERSIDTDVISNGNIKFVYTKLPHLLIIGYICLVDKNKWRDTKLHVKNGIFNKTSVFPKKLWEFIQSKANHHEELKNTMSERQKDKINESYNQLSRDHIIASETIKSLRKDIRLFGDKSFFENDEDNDK